MILIFLIAIMVIFTWPYFAAFFGIYDKRRKAIMEARSKWKKDK